MTESELKELMEGIRQNNERAEARASERKLHHEFWGELSSPLEGQDARIIMLVRARHAPCE